MITNLFIKSNVHNQNLAESVNNISINLIILKVKIVSIDWFFIILDFITELIKKKIANKLLLRKETKLIF
jgi:hypothetical protein